MIRRRAFTALVVLALAGCAPRTPLNYVLICVDAARYDVFTHADGRGSPDALTPWSGRALRFTDAWSASSWTIPGVSSAMTGLYPIQHGAGMFTSRIANVDNTLPTGLGPERVTLFERLQSHGYRTVAWVHTPWMARLGLAQGVETVHEVESGRVTEEFLAWTRKGEHPFAAYLHLMQVHGRHTRPMDVMRRDAAAIPPALAAEWRALAPAGACADASSDRCAAFLNYAASVRDVRAQLAATLAELERTKVLRNTVVVVFSDHGEAFGEHAASPLTASDPRATKGNGMGHGHTLFEELLDIPLYVWNPRASGAVVDAPVSIVDVVPMSLELLGIESKETFVGRTLSQLRDGASERALFASTIAYGADQTAVRIGRWKRIAAACPPARMTFDLRRDPLEVHPLIATDLATRLDAELARFERQRVRPGQPGTITAEDRERLRSIGYLTGGQTAPVPAPCTD